MDRPSRTLITYQGEAEDIELYPSILSEGSRLAEAVVVANGKYQVRTHWYGCSRSGQAPLTRSGQPAHVELCTELELITQPQSELMTGVKITGRRWLFFVTVKFGEGTKGNEFSCPLPSSFLAPPPLRMQLFKVVLPLRDLAKKRWTPAALVWPTSTPSFNWA